MNVYKVEWSQHAKNEFSDLLNYLDKIYGVDTTLRVFEKTEQLADSLCNFPLAFPFSDKNPWCEKSSNYQTNFFTLYSEGE